MKCQMTRIELCFGLLVCVLELPSCGGTQPILRPYSPRVPVLVTPLTSLVGDYQLLNQPFEVLASIALAPEFFDVHQESNADNFEVRTYQNPLRPISKTSGETPKYVVKGEVERIAYEPIQNVKKEIAAYAFWGLIGLAASDGSAGTMAAYVQYRFNVLDTAGTAIDSFVVIGAAAGHPTKVSRRALIVEANFLAAGDFATQLAQHLVLRAGFNTESRRIKHYTRQVKRERWLEYMDVKLKDPR